MTSRNTTRPSAKTPARRGGNAPSRLNSAPGRYDIVLLAAVAVLIGFGLIMVFSASYNQANRLNNGQSTFYVLRQLRWVVVGLVALAAAALVDFRVLKRLALPLMIGTVLLLLAVLIFGEESLGSRRHLVGTSVQPSEVAKVTIIIYIAYWLSSKGHRLKALSDGLAPFGVMLGMVALLIALQPDFDTTALIVLTALVMFFIAGADNKQLIVVVLLVALTFWLAITNSDYAARRVNDYFSFLRDPMAGSDQVQSALRALTRGGWFGQGLGTGDSMVQLPFTDSIFAVIGYELGLLGTLGVVVLFGLLAIRGVRIAQRSQDPFGQILGIGLTAWITLQAFLNMAVNLAVLPFSGLTLPFISYGGSSLLACMAGVGLLLSISRYGARQPAAGRAPAAAINNELSGQEYATPAFGWRNWRTRLPNFGRARSTRNARAYTAQRSRSATGNNGFAVRAASTGLASKSDELGRRVTRARRTIARKTSNSRRSSPASSTSASTSRRVPRRR
ncbi:MAG: putative peptidoglycan glycosyltransferase FtsW [Caldilineales bacterium]